MSWQGMDFSWRAKLALLLLGALCFAFGQGRWPIPILAWIAPILLLSYMRASRAWVGVLGITVAHAAAWEIAYMGMVKMPMFARWGLFLGLSLFLSFVFLADRWVSRRNPRFWATLVFPSGWAAFEYLLGRFSPNGSWGSLSYTFTDHTAFVQVASLVGWTGIAFLVGWVATVVLWVLRERSSGAPVWRRAMVCAGVVLAVLVFGSLRLALHSPSETIRVASLVGPSSFLEKGEFRRDVWAYTRGIDLPPGEVQAAQRHILKTMEDHMALAERELRDGARIVSFPEANPYITQQEEEAFVAAASTLAVEYEAYVGVGLFVFRPEAGLPAENKYVLVGPDGSIAIDYLKSRLVPGSSHVVGEGVLPDVETDFGRLSAAICFDMDFPSLLSQAGRQDADIVLAPSNDWTEVRSIHARMATLRAIEQGFNLVRPTKDGHSIVTDSLGRTVAWQNTDRPGDHVLVAQVPTTGVRTLYSRISDLFSWLCIAAFFGILALSRNPRARPA